MLHKYGQHTDKNSILFLTVCNAACKFDYSPLKISKWSLYTVCILCLHLLVLFPRHLCLLFVGLFFFTVPLAQAAGGYYRLINVSHYSIIVYFYLSACSFSLLSLFVWYLDQKSVTLAPVEVSLWSWPLACGLWITVPLSKHDQNWQVLPLE